MDNITFLALTRYKTAGEFGIISSQPQFVDFHTPEQPSLFHPRELSMPRQRGLVDILQADVPFGGELENTTQETLSLCASSGIGPVPVELSRNIIEMLGERDSQSLKTLRLMSRTTGSIATERLFQILYLDMRKTSWAKVRRIAATTRLACHVHMLQLTLVRPHPTFKECIRWSRDPAYDEGILPKRSLFCDISEAPKLNLELLPNLRTIRSSDWRSSDSVLNDLMQADLFIIRPQDPPLLPWPEKRQPWPKAILERMLLPLVFRSILTSSFPLEILHLHMLADILKRQLSPKIGFSQLHTLKLDLFHSMIKLSEFRPYAMLDPTKILVQWFRFLPALQSFTLIQDEWTYPDINVLKILRAVEWPRLAHVRFRFVKTSAADIKAFLEQHRRTLRTVRIEQPMLEPEEWHQLVIWIRGLDLEVFEYTDLFQLKGPLSRLTVEQGF